MKRIRAPAPPGRDHLARLPVSILGHLTLFTGFDEMVKLWQLNRAMRTLPDQWFHSKSGPEPPWDRATTSERAKHRGNHGIAWWLKIAKKTPIIPRLSTARWMVDYGHYIVGRHEWPDFVVRNMIHHNQKRWYRSMDVSNALTHTLQRVVLALLGDSGEPTHPHWVPLNGYPGYRFPDHGPTSLLMTDLSKIALSKVLQTRPESISWSAFVALFTCRPEFAEELLPLLTRAFRRLTGGDAEEYPVGTFMSANSWGHQPPIGQEIVIWSLNTVMATVALKADPDGRFLFDHLLYDLMCLSANTTRLFLRLFLHPITQDVIQCAYNHGMVKLQKLLTEDVTPPPTTEEMEGFHNHNNSLVALEMEMFQS